MNFPQHLDEKDMELFLKECRLAGFELDYMRWHDDDQTVVVESLSEAESVEIWPGGPVPMLVYYDRTTRGWKRGKWDDE
jgi:hypothetical protein